jgi:hypothetical protein
MPNAGAARRVLVVMLSLGFAACAAPPGWEKPGVKDATIAWDEFECRADAKRDTARLYPFGFGPPYTAAYSDSSWSRWWQNNLGTENRLLELCMLNKGYSRTTSA